jgi:hypothetical protein
MRSDVTHPNPMTPLFLTPASSQESFDGTRRVYRANAAQFWSFAGQAKRKAYRGRTEQEWMALHATYTALSQASNDELLAHQAGAANRMRSRLAELRASK